MYELLRAAHGNNGVPVLAYLDALIDALALGDVSADVANGPARPTGVIEVPPLRIVDGEPLALHR